MRRVFLYMLAAFMLASCDNLKKKDAKSDTDDEEVVKKKKKMIEDDNTDDETPKKKKLITNDDDITPTTKKQDNTDDDYTTRKRTTDYSTGWSSTEEDKFMDQCTRTASPKVGATRAQAYCSCMMGKMEREFSTFKEASQMSETQLNTWAAECNEQ